MSVKNLDIKTVNGFGEEWNRFQQNELSPTEFNELCERYFQIFPWKTLKEEAQGFDLGCGSGRFAKFVAPKVSQLYCIDASEKALSVSKITLKDQSNCEFILSSVDEIPLKKESMDFGYSLGVLHHIPNTQEGIQHCVNLLKPGAPFLLYLYYSFDNRPWWFKLIWQTSEVVRKLVSSMPFSLRKRVTDIIALCVYLPLAKTAKILEKLGCSVDNLPLSAYRHNSFYTMRTDSLDRFGTGLEQRFSKEEIAKMMTQAGLEKIEFSNNIPYWVAIGFKKS
ncbi:MAG: class I SAM-dependent methyltransferase [Bdellovibrionaceae bacterium]|nr:class I SAM-dependent methyltransferase [Pseudobdellovibrionaceae bacterium]